MTINRIVLARKYRPKTLQEIVGQEVFVKTISNAIETGQLHHAFLLTGTRGVGKTSSARILALSINCQKFNKETTTPCLECDCCKQILSGSNPDVIEIDAASNTGVDNVRKLIEECSFAPMISRYKVYIIDEVHMLSKSAFNALLKTLEEPPERVKFIFATTEVNKVPITILSRCQKFYLKNISEDIICLHLKSVCEKEGIKYDDESLRLIAKYGNGSMRDSLSLLDQAISIGNGEIKIDTIKNMLSIPDRMLISRLFYNVYIGDIQGAIEDANNFLSGNIEIQNIVSDLMNIILDGLKLVSGVITKNDICYEFQEVFIKLIDENNLNIPRLLRMWQVISNSLEEMKMIQTNQYFIALIYKMCYISTLPTPVDVLKMFKQPQVKHILQNIPNSQIVK